jgi:hypothetical protein
MGLANPWPIGVEMVLLGGSGVLMSLQKAPTGEMKAPWTDPGLRELLALAVVAASVVVSRSRRITSSSPPFLLLQAQWSS